MNVDFRKPKASATRKRAKRIIGLAALWLMIAALTVCSVTSWLVVFGWIIKNAR